MWMKFALHQLLYHWTLTVIQHVEMCHIMLQYLVMLYIQTLLVALNTPLIIWRVIHHTTLQLHLCTTTAALEHLLDLWTLPCHNVSFALSKLLQQLAKDIAT